MQNHLSTPPTAPLTPVYLNQSCYNHGPYPVESYANFNPVPAANAIPYYKPPEVQAFCLVPDRQSPQTQYPQQTLQPNPYYSIPVSNPNHQNVKSTFPSSIYPISGPNDSRIHQNSSNQLFSTPSLTTGFIADKPILSNDFTGMKYPEKTFLRTGAKLNSGSGMKSPTEERYSDESSNFDFTIEAEKMVSALCNTTVHEFDKEEDDRVKNDAKSSLSHDSIDGIDKNFKPWYFHEFPSEPNLSVKSVATQTNDPFEESQYPELIRKILYWGCNEAEMLFKNSTSISPRQNWLLNLSSATRIALAKSSTCFPIFSGDRVFSQDLINSLLRIGNGWLVLDNYLNKPHHPNLTDKVDNDLTKSFKKWEASTYELLGNVIKSFVKLDNTSVSNDTGNIPINTSFPGDVSLYVNSGLFGGDSAIQNIQQTIPTQQISLLKPLIGFNRNLPYPIIENQEKHRWSIGKESKLRTKWTITEQSRTSGDFSMRKPKWKIFTQEFPVQPEVSQQKLQYNFLLPPAEENSTEISLQPTQILQIKRFEAQPCIQKCSTLDLPTNINSTVPISLPNDGARTFWNPYIPPGPSYNNYPCQETTLANLDNGITLLSQIETKRTEVANTNDGETINLSAWFASMRNRRVTNLDTTNSTTNSTNWWVNSKASNPPPKLRESSRSSIDLAGTSRMDINRQLRTLRNMRTIQSAPWTANHLLDDHHNSEKRLPDEYDSSEDVRVYMKPGSYNVPKKKYQSRRSQRRDSAGHKNPATQTNFEREDNRSHDSRVHSNVSTSSSSTCSQEAARDATWKAACASAELLLDALKIKDASQSADSPDNILNSTLENMEDGDDRDDDDDDDFEWQCKNFEDNDDESNRMSSYEGSDDDSESCKLSSLDSSAVSRESHSRTNVKTDSWLIRTLNNVTNGSKINNEENKESIINESNIVPWKKSIDTANKAKERSYSLETSHTIAVMTLVDVVGKATYSETVRRYSSSAKPTIPSFPAKIEENKSIRSLLTINEAVDEESERIMDNLAIKDRVTKVKKGKNQPGDRGWSVWYSSRRKQHNNSLGPITLAKLVSIHRALWKMDVNRVFKCPTGNEKNMADSNESTESLSIESYRKIVKSPVFLETIGYKLKNHVYRKVEHVIRDFRKIVHNSKLYHKVSIKILILLTIIIG